MKKILITVAMAALTGAVLIGMNVASGAATYNPPGGAVSPTFSGVNVEGTAAINELDVLTTLTNSSGYLKLVDDVINIEGVVTNPSQNFVIDDKLEVTGQIDAQAGIVNSTSATSPVEILGNLKVLGTSDLDTLTVAGKITASGGFGSIYRVPDVSGAAAANGGAASAYPNCNSGDFLLSCTFNANHYLNVYDNYPEGSLCNIRAKNTSSTTAYAFIGYALCLDSDA